MARDRRGYPPPLHPQRPDRSSATRWLAVHDAALRRSRSTGGRFATNPYGCGHRAFTSPSTS